MDNDIKGRARFWSALGAATLIGGIAAMTVDENFGLFFLTMSLISVGISECLGAIAKIK